MIEAMNIFRSQYHDYTGVAFPQHGAKNESAQHLQEYNFTRRCNLSAKATGNRR